MNGTSNPFKVMLSKAADGVTQKAALVATAVALGTAAVLLVWFGNNLGKGISEWEYRKGNLKDICKSGYMGGVGECTSPRVVGYAALLLVS